MQNINKFYIDGKWVEPKSQSQFRVLNPASEKEIGVTILGNLDDVNMAVFAAKKAFNTYSQTNQSQRLSLLESLLSVMERRFEDLAQSMTLEMGAPITFSRDQQADSGVGHLKSFIECLRALKEREILINGDILVREPVGICGLITPWNWPINQIALKVIPALAVGCTCILKPSEHTPVSAMIFAEIIDEAGFPRGTFNLVQGDGPTVGVALAKQEGYIRTWREISKFSFCRL